MATPQENIARFQEIANRGLQDQLDPEKRGIFDEAVNRGIITVDKAEQGLLDTAIGAVDLAGAAITGIAKEGIKGISAVGGLIDPTTTPLQGIENAEALQAALPNFQLGEQGQALLQTLIDKFKDSPQILQDIVSAASTLGPDISEATFKATGSPLLAAGAGIIPGALEAVTGIKGARAASGAIDAATTAKPIGRDLPVSGQLKLVDQKTGEPTQGFTKALEDKGLTFDNVSGDVIDVADNIEPKQAVNQIIKKKLLSGDRDDALATFKLSDLGVVKDDDFAKEALKQGFQAGDIQSIKTSSPSTKKGMREIAKITKRVRANSSLEIRPTDVAGRAAMKRFTHIRGAADKAKLELDNIASTQLKGVDIDFDTVEADMLSELDKLDIDFSPDSPINFKGSQISKDRTSQKVIKDVMDLLNETGRPDAQRAHKLKRQLDRMVDFRRQSPGGLTEAGKGFAKSVRASLNNSIRAVNDDYADVNDVLSESIGTLDGFQKVLGPSINVFADGAEKAVGQDLRGLLSNRKSRIKLENSLKSLDDTAKNLGGKFDDNIRDLVNFAEVMDDQFGVVAKTGFKGQVASGVKQGLRGKAGVQELIINKAVDVAEAFEGINEKNALRAIDNLLRE